MPGITPLLLILLATTLPHQTSASLPYTQLKTLVSLAHSLTTRVANLRASRGDYAGAQRAHLLAAKLDQARASGFRFWKLLLSMGWDYAKHYAWRDLDYREVNGFVRDVNELMSGIGEWTRLGSDAERVEWVGRNYRNVLGVSKNLLARLLKVFSHSGPLREMVEAVQRDVVEGDILRDCLELGSNDLKGLIQIFKDVVSQFYPSHGGGNYRHEL